MSTLETMYTTSFPDRVHNAMGKDQIFTPVHIAKEMVQAIVEQIPEEQWNKELKILDIYCKSGIFLYEFYLELFSRTKHLHFEDGLTEKEVEQKCREWILNNQLYGICTDPFLQLISIRTVYGHIPETSNIKYINNFDNLVNNKNSKLFWDTLKEQFGEETMKKFGVVIGNPPYNKGMDLDFVHKGFQLSNNITCMITPAKWQTAADDYSGCASKNINYKQFREKLVPHMNAVCFYPEPKDIFNILQIDGITWYTMDKNTHEEKLIINKCSVNTYFNSVTTRKLIERERESLHNIGSEIVHSLGDYKRFKFPKIHNCRYEVWVNNQVSLGGASGGPTCTFTTQGNCTTIGACRLLDSEDSVEMSLRSGASNCIFSSDSKEQCENFISWLNCKFTRFFVAINISKLTGILTDDYFRFVPAPLLKEDGAYNWDIKYTDELLYNYYNLDDKYIQVIESVIKERK